MTNDDLDGQRALWGSVIQLALEDARSDHPKEHAARIEARRWFEKAGADFRRVCKYAGCDHEVVQAFALKIIAEYDATGLKKHGRQNAIANPRTGGRGASRYTHAGVSLTLKSGQRERASLSPLFTVA